MKPLIPWAVECIDLLLQHLCCRCRHARDELLGMQDIFVILGSREGEDGVFERVSTLVFGTG